MGWFRGIVRDNGEVDKHRLLELPGSKSGICNGDVFKCTWVEKRCSSTVHIYTNTLYRTTQLKLCLEGFLGFEPRVVELKLTKK